MQRLMRVWYETDAVDDGVGTMSEPFASDDDLHRIVAVDWSTPGRVEVTWAVQAELP